MIKHLFITCLAGMMSLSCAYAQSQNGLSSQEIIVKAENWFEKISTMSAEFIQVSSDGSAATGKLYLRRPAQMRLQYDGDGKVAMIVSQGWLHIDEGAEKRVNSYPISSTPFALMLKDDIQFRSPSFKTRTASDKGVVSVTLIQETGEAAGRLTLEFSETPFQLRKWIIEDAVGVTTKVTIQNPRFGDSFNNFLFTVPPYSSP